MLRLREALRIKRDLDDGLGLTLGLEGVAGCLCSRGEFVRAAMLLGASDRMRETTQTAWFGPHHTVLRDIHIDQAVNALDRSATARPSKRASGCRGHAIDDALGVAASTRPRANRPTTLIR